MKPVKWLVAALLLLATAPAVALDEAEQYDLAARWAAAKSTSSAFTCDVRETWVVLCYVRTDDASLEPVAEMVVRDEKLEALRYHGWTFVLINHKTGTLLERPFKLRGGTSARLYPGFCREKGRRGWGC